MTHRCPTCQAPLDEHERHVRFIWPDVVRETPAIDPESQVWMSHDSPDLSDAMSVEGLGAFVRSLLAVKLDDGTCLTFGVWVGITGSELEVLGDQWGTDAYATIALEGRLANRILPWDCLAAPVNIGVVDPAQLPYCTRSEDPVLASVLTGSWPAEEILATLPDW